MQNNTTAGTFTFVLAKYIILLDCSYHKYFTFFISVLTEINTKQ